MWLDVLINKLKLKEHECAKEAYEYEQKAKILRAEEFAYRDIADIANDICRNTNSSLLQQELPNSNIEIKLIAEGETGSGKGIVLTFVADALRQKGCTIVNTGENSIRIFKPKNDNS